RTEALEELAFRFRGDAVDRPTYRRTDAGEDPGEDESAAERAADGHHHLEVEALKEPRRTVRHRQRAQEVRQNEHGRDADDQAPAGESVPDPDAGAAPVLDVARDVARDDRRAQRGTQDEPDEVVDEEVVTRGREHQPDARNDQERTERDRDAAKDRTPARQ